MAVYFIQGESRFAPVKIGHSQDPELRLVQLQISHWEILRIIRLFEGGEAEENALHVRFIDLHIRGEWHSFSRAMMGDVGLVEIEIKEEVTSIPPHPGFDGLDPKYAGSRLYYWLRSSQITQKEAAAAIGANQSMFSHWCTGHRRVPADQAVRMNRALGVPLHEVRPDLWPSSAANVDDPA